MKNQQALNNTQINQNERGPKEKEPPYNFMQRWHKLIQHWHVGLRRIFYFLKDIQRGEELEFVTQFLRPVLFPEILIVLAFGSSVQSSFPSLLPVYLEFPINSFLLNAMLGPGEKRSLEQLKTSLGGCWRQQKNFGGRCHFRSRNLL